MMMKMNKMLDVTPLGGDVDYAQLVKPYGEPKEKGRSGNRARPCASARADGRRGHRRSGARQHVTRRAPQPHYEDADAAVHERVQQERREPLPVADWHERHRMLWSPVGRIGRREPGPAIAYDRDTADVHSGHAAARRRRDPDHRAARGPACRHDGNRRVLALGRSAATARLHQPAGRDVPHRAEQRRVCGQRAGQPSAGPRRGVRGCRGDLWRPPVRAGRLVGPEDRLAGAAALALRPSTAGWSRRCPLPPTRSSSAGSRRWRWSWICNLWSMQAAIMA